MATKQLVTKVWIAPGCIVCDACETTCPEVFNVTEDTCLIRPEALDAEFTKPRTETIIEAAEECPVEVIKYETIEVDAADAPAPVDATAASAAPATEKPAAAEAKPEKVAASEKADAKATRPAAAAVAAQTNVSKPVGAVDPTVQALLQVTTSRGGRAGMERGGQESPAAVKAVRSQKIDELPPDARYRRVLEAAKSEKSQSNVSRRAMITAAGAGWLAIGGSSLISLAALQRFMMPNVLDEPDPRVRVGDLTRYVEMPVGGVNEDFKRDGIWIVRLEREIAALSIVCTHLGCIPSWMETERKFKCPCHGSGFTQEGINFEGPAPRPLERFRISVEDGMVVVDMSRKFQQEKGEWSNPESFIPV